MSTSVLAIAQPPWEMTTPGTVQTLIIAILSVVVVAFMVAALVDWRRTGRPTFLLMLVGGYVCSFNEALVDVIGHCFFPTDGVIGYATFGRAIPVWVILAYVVFFGALAYVMSEAFKRGVTYRMMWLGIGVFGVLNAVLEVPLLGSGLYVYYGDQPFVFGGFPIIWLVINSLGALFGAVVITRLSWFFTGARQLLLVLVPFATYMASWVVAMPHFAITNTDAPTAVRMAAAVISIGLGLVAIDALIRLGTGQWRLLPPQVVGGHDERGSEAVQLPGGAPATRV